MTEPEAPFCLECGRKLRPLPINGSICLRCERAFEHVEHNGIRARVLVVEGRGEHRSKP